MLLMLKALWAYRQFIVSSVLREFNGRYRASLLGALWAVVQPLTMIVIYTVIFGRLMQASLPGHDNTPYAFSIYLCAGVITWTLFAELLTRLTAVFLEHATLIKKTNFPRICLPAIVTGSALINFTIIFSLYLGFLAIIGHLPGLPLLAIVPLVLLQLLFALGLGVLLGSLNVFFRDVAQFTGVVLQFWFWLTPIVYTLQIVPEELRGVFALNPLLPVISGYQAIFLDQRWPDFDALIPFAATTICVLLVGFIFFMRRVDEMVDEL